MYGSLCLACRTLLEIAARLQDWGLLVANCRCESPHELGLVIEIRHAGFSHGRMASTRLRLKETLRRPEQTFNWMLSSAVVILLAEASADTTADVQTADI